MSDTRIEARRRKLNTVRTEAGSSRGVLSGEGSPQAMSASANGCADARASSNHEADSSDHCADEKRSTPPPELEEIIREIKANEQRVAEIISESGQPPMEKLDAEQEQWWLLERAWIKWAERQPDERFVVLLKALAGMFYPQTENHALLNELAWRLDKSKRRGAAPAVGQRAGRRNDEASNGTRQKP